MDRLFSHHVFAALIIATIGAGIVPSLVERWSNDHEEAVQQQTQMRIGEIKEGAAPTESGAPPRHETLLSGATMLVAVSGLCVTWWFVAARREGRLWRRPLTRWLR